MENIKITLLTLSLLANSYIALQLIPEAIDTQGLHSLKLRLLALLAVILNLGSIVWCIVYFQEILI